MATNLTNWYDDVLPYANGCPAPVALQKIRAAAILWAKLSRCWQYLSLTPIDVVANQSLYLIGTDPADGTLPANSTVVHIYEASYNGQRLTAKTPKDFRALSETWFSDAGDPEYFTLFNTGELAVWRIPEANLADGIRVPLVALAPDETATAVDDSFFKLHRTAIAKGALSMIHAIEGKPYTNQALATQEERDFRIEAGSVLASVESGRGHARLRTQTIIR